MFISKFKQKIVIYNPDLFSEENRKILKIASIITVFGILLFLFDFICDRLVFDGTLTRNDIGSGKYTEDLLVSVDEEQFDYEMTVNVPALTNEQITECFEKAKREIDESCTNDNESLDHIELGLVINESYANGLVKAVWEFDNYKLLGVDGKVIGSEISPWGELVTACVTLVCQDEVQEYSFSFRVFPKTLSAQEKAKELIDEAVAESDEKYLYDETLILPNTYNGKNILWKKRIKFRGIQISLLATVIVLGIIFGSRADIRKKEQDLIKKKLKDYPQIVSNLSILMGAGMSFKAAIDRMCKSYIARQSKNSSTKSPGYEELLIVGREMHDGIGEIDAINNMGRRSGVKEYRKLAMLLTQNIKKGTSDLIIMLEKEDHLAFELRKSMAIRAGEEASTKLMLPMMGMLGIVLVILMVPAMLSMNM